MAFFPDKLGKPAPTQATSKKISFQVTAETGSRGVEETWYGRAFHSNGEV